LLTISYNYCFYFSSWFYFTISANLRQVSSVFHH